MYFRYMKDFKVLKIEVYDICNTKIYLSRKLFLTPKNGFFTRKLLPGFTSSALQPQYRRDFKLFQSFQEMVPAFKRKLFQSGLLRFAAALCKVWIADQIATGITCSVM